MQWSWKAQEATPCFPFAMGLIYTTHIEDTMLNFDLCNTFLRYYTLTSQPRAWKVIKALRFLQCKLGVCGCPSVHANSPPWPQWGPRTPPRAVVAVGTYQSPQQYIHGLPQVGGLIARTRLTVHKRSFTRCRIQPYHDVVRHMFHEQRCTYASGEQ